MIALAASGSGFLLAVLWFDLMFDAQSRNRTDPLPAEIFSSISSYYRRVTTGARPMNRLVSLVMALTVLAIAAEIAQGAQPRWPAWASLALVVSAIGLAASRTFRNAVQLGRGEDPVEVQTGLARSIYRDHRVCFVAMIAVLGLQLSAAL